MIHNLTARNTLTAIELDRRDQLHFKRFDGRVVSITVLNTACEIVKTDLDPIKVEQPNAITHLRFTCGLDINGKRHELERHVTSQLSFYDPFEIEGLRIWPDAVDDIFEFLDETHGECRPRKHLRLALQDATERICPPLLHPWCPLAEEGLDIRECYNNDDAWLGSYFGASAHGGLDINHPRGTPIWAPIDLDDQWLFNTESEHGNNRWRAIHTWEDGSAWIFQVHHLIDLCQPEHQTVSAGTQVARGAGVAVGTHDHSHFEFKIREPGQEEQIHLDPWILFWQMYQDRTHFPQHFYSRGENPPHKGHYET